MKVSKRQLRRIIKEEKARFLREAPTPYEREEARRFSVEDVGVDTAHHSRESLETEITSMADRLADIANEIEAGKHAYEEYEAQDLHDNLHQMSHDLFMILEEYGV